MLLHQILLPIVDNSGRSYAAEHVKFTDWLLDHISGYTQLPDVKGAWRKNEITFHDTMRPYHIACTEEKFSEVLVKAAALFTDQHAFFIADIGESQTIMREFAIERNPNLWLQATRA